MTTAHVVSGITVIGLAMLVALAGRRWVQSYPHVVDKLLVDRNATQAAVKV